jgi:hypothetical protein
MSPQKIFAANSPLLHKVLVAQLVLWDVQRELERALGFDIENMDEGVAVIASGIDGAETVKEGAVAAFAQWLAAQLKKGVVAETAGPPAAAPISHDSLQSAFGNIPLRKRGADFLCAAARLHGQDSEADHEVGDLQEFLHKAFARLTSRQVGQFYDDGSVIEVLAAALGYGSPAEFLAEASPAVCSESSWVHVREKSRREYLFIRMNSSDYAIVFLFFFLPGIACGIEAAAKRARRAPYVPKKVYGRIFVVGGASQ